MSCFVSYIVYGALSENDINEIKSQSQKVNAGHIWQSQNIIFTSNKNLAEGAGISGKSNVGDSIADISCIIDFFLEVSKKYPHLQIKLDYSQELSSNLPEIIQAGTVTPANWKPLKKKISSLEVNVDKILWGWWKGQEESTDAQALNDLLILFIDNFYEDELRLFNPQKTLDIKTAIPEDTITKCKEHIEKYGCATFINSCLAWARLEEEKLKAQFTVQQGTGQLSSLL